MWFVRRGRSIGILEPAGSDAIAPEGAAPESSLDDYLASKEPDTTEAPPEQGVARAAPSGAIASL